MDDIKDLIARGPKIDVFISSIINSKTIPFRKQLKDMLDKSDAFRAYLFEDPCASSLPIPECYLTPLRNSQAIVLLIDNEEGVSDPVFREYTEAKKCGLHILAFFCSETSDKETPLQAQIRNEGKCKYAVLSHLADFPAQAYFSLHADVIWLYMEKVLPFAKTVGPLSFSLPETKRLELSVEKNVLTTFSKAKNDLKNYVFSGKTDADENKESLDELFRLFLPVVLGDKHFDTVVFTKISKAIIEQHKEPLQKIISIRLSALQDFYTGKLDQCIAELKKALEASESQASIPEWIRNDVAIDLRNIQDSLDQENGIINPENEGQRKLNESNESLYFPFLDRLSSSIRGNIIEEYQRIFKQSPNTTRFSNDALYFDDVASYFCTALFYGSITHLGATRYYMIDLIDALNQNDFSRGFYLQELKYSVLENEDQKISDLLRTCPRIEPYTSEDLENIGKCLENLPLKKQRDHGRLLLIKHFGDCYSDSFFKEEQNWLFAYIRGWINDPKRDFNSRQDFFDALMNNCQRYPAKDLFELILLLIKNLNQFGCELIPYIDFKQITESNQKEMLDSLLQLLPKKKGESINIQMQYPLISFYQKATIKKTGLIFSIKRQDPVFYNGIFLLETRRERKNSRNQIARCLNGIKKDNTKHGVLIGGQNDYQTILEILKIYKYRPVPEELKEIVSVINQTLSSGSQTTKAKCSAFDLLNYLVDKFLTKKARKEEKAIILALCSSALWMVADNPLEDVGQACLNLSLNLALLSLGRPNQGSFLISVSSVLSSNKKNKIQAAKSLASFLQATKKTAIKRVYLAFLTQFALTLIREDEIAIRYYAYRCLIELTHTQMQTVALESLSFAMNNDSAPIRLEIVQSISEVASTKEFKTAINERAKIDDSFLVRKNAI